MEDIIHTSRISQCIYPFIYRTILFECRYSRRIWTAAASWLSCPDLLRCLGTGRPKVLDYWNAIAKTPSSSPKGLRTAIMLITWEIWKERNERVFNNKSSLPSVIMHKIREEGKDWILAGAKSLAELMGWLLSFRDFQSLISFSFFGFGLYFVCSFYINIRQAFCPVSKKKNVGLALKPSPRMTRFKVSFAFIPID